MGMEVKSAVVVVLRLALDQNMVRTAEKMQAVTKRWGRSRPRAVRKWQRVRRGRLVEVGGEVCAVEVV